MWGNRKNTAWMQSISAFKAEAESDKTSRFGFPFIRNTDTEDKLNDSTAAQSAKSKCRMVKSCASHGILPCLRAKKLACSCFVDAGRRHKIPESETKDFIAHSKSSIFRASCSFVLVLHAPKSHRTDTKGLWWMPGHEVSCNRGNTEFRGFIVCIVSESQPALFPRGETLPSPRLLAINTTCRNGPCKEWLRLCIHGIPSKNTQGHSGPMADCLSQQSTPQPTITHSWPNLNF